MRTNADGISVITDAGIMYHSEEHGVPKKQSEPGGLALFFRKKNHDLRNAALQQRAELVDGVGGNAFAVLHCIVGAARETQLFKPIGRNTALFQRFKKRLIADHAAAPPLFHDKNSI